MSFCEIDDEMNFKRIHLLEFILSIKGIVLKNEF